MQPSCDDLVAAADAALYRAKTSGGDQVMVATILRGVLFGYPDPTAMLSDEPRR